VEPDPQDGSDWPFHKIIYAEYNPTTQQWDLYYNVKTALNISKPDKSSAVDEARYQLVAMSRQQE
jgi:hypothetical protein